VREDERPGTIQNLITFLVSAFWHGFYPFYYVMFIFAGLFAELTKDIYRSRIFFEFIPSFLRPIIGW
jgi:lysophospholipid acyltransferase